MAGGQQCGGKWELPQTPPALSVTEGEGREGLASADQGSAITHRCHRQQCQQPVGIADHPQTPPVVSAAGVGAVSGGSFL